MKAFPFAIWPGELIKAGPPDQSPYHGSRLLDPAQSYSIPGATRVVDSDRPSPQRAISAETLNSIGGKGINLAETARFAHPTTSVYGSDSTDGFLPAGHAHRNADIKGRLHFQASADHDAAFHELSDLHRAIAATGSPSPDHMKLLDAARRQLKKTEMALTHARSGHAKALAEPMLEMPDTHHNKNGSERGRSAATSNYGAELFPAISFDVTADPNTGRAAKSSFEVAEEMASMGSTPFFAAYQGSGFLPQGNLEAALDGKLQIFQHVSPTPKEVSDRYQFLAEQRRAGIFKGKSDLDKHVADGTSIWSDYSGTPESARAFHPRAPAWARTWTLRGLLDKFSPQRSR